MPWFKSKHFLEHLESVELKESEKNSARLPVQYVIRPRDEDHHDFRGYAGRVIDGEFSVGQKVSVLPSKNQTTIKEIFVSLESVEKASSQMAATLLLEDEIDISRGDVIVPSDGLPEVSDTIEAKVCWMSDEPLWPCLLYTSPSPRDQRGSRMPSSA